MRIITTNGPSSRDEATMRALLAAGASVMRCSLSKATPEYHVTAAADAKRIAAEEGKQLLLMADLPAGKPRLSNAEPMEIAAGARFTIAVGEDAASRAGVADLYVDPPVPDGLFVPGDLARIGDGEDAFRIEAVEPGLVRGSFLRGGHLDRARAFLPDTDTWRIPAFTPRDQALARIAKEAGFDWLAISYVSRAEDLDTARMWLREELAWEPVLVAKIETLDAVAHIGEIALAADWVMVARGDLAVQAGIERIYEAQCAVQAACVAAGTPVIVATGLLDGMQHQDGPSRSEVIDICNALERGAAALMLSGETSIGPRPVEAVRALRAIASRWSERVVAVGE